MRLFATTFDPDAAKREHGLHPGLHEALLAIAVLPIDIPESKLSADVGAVRFLPAAPRQDR
ncbi:hypothetical protein B5K06_27885 [Rhizobium grahamii]|uniref:Uncharacterized protein n=1 Tax=Rhizobium grahamii TaxID=1120045 RepID=A0A370KG63_9HYPH|nr:hypothetical protein B5K06_27885 [Rhizobium grahamii]